jgi:hypothetical protein
MSYADSCHYNTSSVFLCLSVDVQLAFSSIDSPGISAYASNLLSSGETQQFQDQFGDVFVRGIQTGGQFFAVIEVLTQDETDKSSVSASMSASFSAFSGSGQFDSNFQKTVSTHETKVTCHIEGGEILVNGTPAPIPIHIDDMTAAATSFHGTVKSNPVPYYALLDPYSILPLPAPLNLVDLQHQRDVLVQCAVLRNQEQQWLNDVAYIEANADQFVGVDLSGLGTLRDNISSDLDNIAQAASNAINNPKSAKMPEGLKVVSPSLPSRVIHFVPPPPQLLVNPGFETGLAPWRANYQPQNVHLAVDDSGGAKEGSAYLRVQMDGPSAGGGGSVAQDVAVDAQVGTIYTFQIWARPAAGTPPPGINVHLWALGGTQEDAGTDVVLGTDWTLATAELQVQNPGHNLMRVEVYCGGGSVLELDAALLHGPP